MSTISPFLLEIGPVRRFITRNLPAVEATTMIGLLAYLTRSPESRLGVVSFAVWQGCLCWTATWSAARNNPTKLEAKICAWTIGLVASSIAKFACWTNNPVWPIMHDGNGGWNKTGILFFALALARNFQRSSSDGVSNASTSEKPPKGPSALASFGLAGIFFGLHSLLSDSSTMILWVWDGYPVRGPLAVPHGAWTIFAMGLGLLSGLFYPNLARSWTAFGVGSVGAAVVTGFSHWFGYYGGLVLTIYLLAITPPMITNAVRLCAWPDFLPGLFRVQFHGAIPRLGCRIRVRSWRPAGQRAH